VPHVVGAAGQRRGDLSLGERNAAGLLPDPPVDAFGEHRVIAAVQVVAEQSD